MKKETLKWTIKAVSFILIGIFLFLIVQLIFTWDIYGGWYHSWINRTEDVDILILGSSHSKQGIRALDMQTDLKETFGKDIQVFNYTPPGMQIDHIYFSLIELFKTREPDIVIIETFSFGVGLDYFKDNFTHWAFDELPWSLNKIEAIRYCSAEGRLDQYIFPIIKFHTRWIDMSWKDFDPRLLSNLVDVYTLKEHIWNGSQVTENMEDPGDGWFQQTIPEEDDLQEITETQKECFKKILDLLKEKDIPLLLVSVPFRFQTIDSIEQIRINHYLREKYVDGEMVRLLDMNSMWEEMEIGYDDLGNEGHLNQKGSEKVTSVLLQYLKENYDLVELTQ